jgi:hypothetical protein
MSLEQLARQAGAGLTAREREVLALLATDPTTVASHRASA